MIACPKCQQKLHDTAVRCQFCGTDLATVPRMALQCPSCGSSVGPSEDKCSFCGEDLSRISPAKRVYRPKKKGEGWETPVYYAISGYYVLDGILDALKGFGLFGHPNGILVGIGGLTAIIGVGLLLKLNFIRGLVNLFCFVEIFFGLLGLGGSLLAGFAFGPVALLGVVTSLLQIVSGGFMIYLLGETEAWAP